MSAHRRNQRKALVVSSRERNNQGLRRYCLRILELCLKNYKRRKTATTLPAIETFSRTMMGSIDEFSGCKRT